MNYKTPKDTYPDARSGIEAYWEGKVKAAGIYAEHYLEAKEVWWEWNEQIGAEMADDLADEMITSETDLSGWEMSKKVSPTAKCIHKWVMEGHNAGDPICSKCYSRDD